jgi:Glycosyltransferase family 87
MAPGLPLPTTSWSSPADRRVMALPRLYLEGSPRARRLATSAFVLVVAIFVAARLVDMYPWNQRFFDLWAYWSTRFGLDYATARPGDSGAYLYSPAFAHLISPITALPLPMFTALWTALIASTLYWLTGWRGFFIGLLAPVAMSIAIGQTDLLMAAAIVIGFRWPAVWLLPIVTKLTPGVGLLWFAARREWRSLAIALGATLAVTAVSFLLDPAAWFGWFAMLARMEFPSPGAGVYLPVPAWVRLPLVALLVVWGARANRRWVLPVAVSFALPMVWINTPTIMVAVAPLIDWGADAPAGKFVRASGADAATLARRVRRRTRRAGVRLQRGFGVAARGLLPAPMRRRGRPDRDPARTPAPGAR